MSIAQSIPWLDIFLSLFFLSLIAIGFWQGLLKGFWFLITLYLGMILASLYGDYVAVFFQRQFGLGVASIASAWGFVAVLLLTTGALFAILYSLVGQLRLPESLLALDKIGGVLIGIIISLILTTFFAFVLNTLIQVGPSEWAFAVILKRQRPSSPMLYMFLSTRWLILSTVQVWMPSGFELPHFLTATSP